MTRGTSVAPLSRRRRLAFAGAAAALVCVIATATLFGVDVYLHRRYAKSASVNIWGYRGPVVGRKQVGEWRIVYLGGSTAFGYGVDWDQAIPAQLQRKLNAIAGVPRTTVINLGYNSEGAYSFTLTLRDYSYLDYDLVCLYEGYNDLLGDTSPNYFDYRHSSPVFRLTGYMPIFPLIFREKVASIRYPGDIGAIYRKDTIKPAFHPGLRDRAVVGALETVLAVNALIEHPSDRPAADDSSRGAGERRGGCAPPWSGYCRNMLDAMEYAVAHGKAVLVISQPKLPGATGQRHAQQQEELARAVHQRFGDDRHVRYVNIEAAVDLADPAVAYDGLHLTVAGNRAVADRLVESIVPFAAQRTR